MFLKAVRFSLIFSFLFLASNVVFAAMGGDTCTSDEFGSTKMDTEGTAIIACVRTEAGVDNFEWKEMTGGGGGKAVEVVGSKKVTQGSNVDWTLENLTVGEPVTLTMDARNSATSYNIILLWVKSGSNDLRNSKSGYGYAMIAHTAGGYYLATGSMSFVPTSSTVVVHVRPVNGKNIVLRAYQ